MLPRSSARAESCVWSWMSREVASDCRAAIRWTLDWCVASDERVWRREWASEIRVLVEVVEGVKVEMLRVRVERAESRALSWLRIWASMMGG